MWKVCTLDRLVVGWDFPPMLIALCGSVPITSFCLPHSAFGGECRRPRCEEWTQKSFTAVSNEASFQTDETVMDEMSLPHSPLCTLITTSISHLSKTKEVEFLQNDSDFHYRGKSRTRQLLVEGSELSKNLIICVRAERVLVPRLLQITSKAPCAATAPAHWTAKTRTPPSETHRRWPVSTPRTATWRWNRPPTAKCPSAALPPSWAALAGMSMMLVSVLSLWCVELSRVLWRLSQLLMWPSVNSHRRRTVSLGESSYCVSCFSVLSCFPLERYKLVRPKSCV